MKISASPEYLLDTNVVIEYLQGVEPTTSFVKGLIKNNQIAFSAIVVAEFLVGAAKPEKEKFNLLLNRFSSIPVDTTIAQLAADYRLELRQKLKTVLLLDCFIAATARLFNLKLVTRNVADYPMKDITIVNPHRL